MVNPILEGLRTGASLAGAAADRDRQRFNDFVKRDQFDRAFKDQQKRTSLAARAQDNADTLIKDKRHLENFGIATRQLEADLAAAGTAVERQNAINKFGDAKRADPGNRFFSKLDESTNATSSVDGAPLDTVQVDPETGKAVVGSADGTQVATDDRTTEGAVSQFDVEELGNEILRHAAAVLPNGVIAQRFERDRQLAAVDAAPSGGASVTEQRVRGVVGALDAEIAKERANLGAPRPAPSQQNTQASTPFTEVQSKIKAEDAAQQQETAARTVQAAINLQKQLQNKALVGARGIGQQVRTNAANATTSAVANIRELSKTNPKEAAKQAKLLTEGTSFNKPLPATASQEERLAHAKTRTQLQNIMNPPPASERNITPQQVATPESRLQLLIAERNKQVARLATEHNISRQQAQEYKDNLKLLIKLGVKLNAPDTLDILHTGDTDAAVRMAADARNNASRSALTTAENNALSKKLENNRKAVKGAVTSFIGSGKTSFGQTSADRSKIANVFNAYFADNPNMSPGGAANVLRAMDDATRFMDDGTIVDPDTSVAMQHVKSSGIFGSTDDDFEGQEENILRLSSGVAGSIRGALLERRKNNIPTTFNSISSEYFSTFEQIYGDGTGPNVEQAMQAALAQIQKGQ